MVAVYAQVSFLLCTLMREYPPGLLAAIQGYVRCVVGRKIPFVGIPVCICEITLRSVVTVGEKSLKVRTVDVDILG